MSTEASVLHLAQQGLLGPSRAMLVSYTSDQHSKHHPSDVCTFHAVTRCARKLTGACLMPTDQWRELVKI